MSFFSKIKNWYLIIILGIVGLMYYNLDRRLDYFEERLDKADGTISLAMYESIEHWSDSFDIPKHVAYNVAYQETRYQGPFDFDYNPRQVSTAGAVGPMQIMPATAKFVNGFIVKPTKLKNNIEFNVMTSMKLLRILYDKYGDWKLVFGCYNTGKPIINKYALKVYNYNPTWIADEEL